jgi:hypothetical protein
MGCIAREKLMRRRARRATDDGPAVGHRVTLAECTILASLGFLDSTDEREAESQVTVQIVMVVGKSLGQGLQDLGRSPERSEGLWPPIPLHGRLRNSELPGDLAHLRGLIRNSVQLPGIIRFRPAGKTAASSCGRCVGEIFPTGEDRHAKDIILAALSLLVTAPMAWAGVKTKTVNYTYDGVTMIGHLAWDDATQRKRPAVLVVHEWWGLKA